MNRVSHLLAGLPKLVLFGLLGAAGGLLGALLLGGWLWAVLVPASRLAQTEPPLRLAASAAVTAFPGPEKPRFPVLVKRQGFDGPIKLEPAALPEGVVITSATIPAGKDTGELEVAVEPGTPPGQHTVKLRARGPSGTEAETVLALAVQAPPPALGVSASPKVEVYQKSKGKFAIHVARSEFVGPIKLEFEGLPAGTSLPAVEIPAHQEEVPLEIAAEAKAPIATKIVRVRATGPKGSPKASTTFEVMIKQLPAPKVDIIFVIDVSGSMDWAILGVRDGIQKFVEELKGKELDFRVGVVLFNNYQDKVTFQGKWAWELRFNGEVFTTDPAALRVEMQKWKAGGGGVDEGSLDGLNEACKQDFRADANKVLLLISDEPPLIPDFYIKSMDQMNDVLRGRGIDQLHLVVRKNDHPRFQPLQKGVRVSQEDKFFDLEQFVKDPKSGAGFAQLLPELSKEIARITVASGPTSPQAKAPPVPQPDRAAILPEASAPTLRAIAGTGTFAQEDSGRLLLAHAVLAAALAACIGVVLVSAQNFYLRQTWVVPADLAKGAVGGTLAGLAGGAAGQFLGQLNPGGGGLGLLFQVFGWALLGTLAGLGMAFIIPNLRKEMGLLGGTLGGVAGGLGFLVASSVLGEFGGHLLGGLLLGLCIGVMVAWAEYASRRFWLEASTGGLEKRLVNLGSVPVSVGSDASKSTIYARNAPAVAFKYWVEGDAIVQEEVAGGTRKTLQPGASQAVGNLTVTVCGATLQGQPGPGPAAGKKTITCPSCGHSYQFPVGARVRMLCSTCKQPIQMTVE